MRCVGLVGASGRMGQRICRLVEGLQNVDELRCFGRGDRLDFSGLDVVIDFSLPEATIEVVQALKVPQLRWFPVLLVIRKGSLANSLK